MKKIGIIIFTAALVAGVVLANAFSFGKITTGIFNFNFGSSAVSGSGNQAAETREVEDFGAIEVGGIFQVDVTAQKDFSVRVEADDNLLPLISTEVEDGVLKIQTREKLRSANPLRVRIAAPNVENIDVSGAAQVSLNDLSNESLQVDASGASKIKLGGATADLTIDASGASRVEAENLRAGDASVETSGASKAVVFVSGNLKTDASGASSIIWSGKPQNFEKKSSGAGSVREK